MGRKKEAASNFASVISKKPDFVQAYEKRGFIYFSDKDYNKALNDFNNAEKYKTVNPEVYYKRAFIYEKDNIIDKAIADYTKCLSYQSDYIKAYKKRGELYYKQQNYGLAIVDLKKAKADYDDEKTNTLLAHAYYYSNNLDKALYHYNDVKNRFRSKDWEVYYNRGLIYVENNKLIEAKNDFGKSIALKKDNYDAYYRRAEVYQKMGKNSIAMRDYGKVILMNPKDPFPFFERGKHHWANKELKYCIADLSKYIKLEKNPKPEAYYLRGASYYLFKENDKACEDLKKAEELGMETAKEMHDKVCID